MPEVRVERFGDTAVSFLTLDAGRCNQCKHVYQDGQRCAAFPKGIPTDILLGEWPHDRPYKGDHGIQFELRR